MSPGTRDITFRTFCKMVESSHVGFIGQAGTQTHK